MRARGGAYVWSCEPDSGHSQGRRYFRVLMSRLLRGRPERGRPAPQEPDKHPARAQASRRRLIHSGEYVLASAFQSFGATRSNTFYLKLLLLGDTSSVLVGHL